MTRAPAKPATLSGRVVRASDGAPIERAVVAIAGEHAGWDESPPPVVATSGSDGRWSASAVVPRDVVLTVTAVGFAPHTRELLVADGEPRLDLVVALDAGGVLVTGTITTEAHEPIANARVRAYRDLNPPRFLAFTGVDGRYELSLPPGPHQLEVTHDDFRRTWKNVAPDDAPIVADFVLVRGGMIHGSVAAGDTGQPIADATVEAIGGSDGSFARAGSDGSFTLRRLHDGTITIFARGHAYASATPTTVVLDPGAELNDVRVVVDPAGAIAGRVVAEDDPSRGIGGAGIRADGGSLPAWGVSDPDGYFELVGMLPDSYWLSADKRGMLFEDGVAVEVVGTDVTDVLIEMRTGATISGRVEPPVAAQIALSRPGGNLNGIDETDIISVQRARTESDATGAFTLRDVPSGDFDLTAMAKDGNTGRVRVTIAGANPLSAVVIRLTPRASISGRVVDDQGQPVAGAYVLSHRVDVPFVTRLKNDGIHRSATTTSDGSFNLIGLDAGDWKLSAAGGTVELELTEGEKLSGVTITAKARDSEIREGSACASAVVQDDPAELTLAPEDCATITGIAVSALSGQPVPGMSVSTRAALAVTDTSGRFVLERVAAGTGELRLRPMHQLVVGIDKYPYTAKPGERVDLGRIAVVPPPTGEVGTFGLRLEVRDAALIVLKVKPNSPADRAGIKAGDSIISIDGHTTAELGPERAQRLLSSETVGTGQTLTLLLGNGTTVIVTAVTW